MYGDEVSLKFYGFVIRYLFAVRRIILVTIYTLKHLKNILVKRDTRKRKYRWYFLTEPNYWKLIKTENDMDVFSHFKLEVA